MSADDNIEIEFPSLARTARSSSPRPGSAIAADAVDQPAQDDSTADDFAWLTAIFADDDETTVEELDGDIDDPDSIAAGEPWADHVEESVIGRNELLEEPLVADDTRRPPDQLRFDESPGRLDLASPPGVTPPTIQGDGDPESDRDTDTTTEAAQKPSTDVPAPHDESTTVRARTDLPGLAELKKVNGFREEILSTFSQMYRKSARPD